MIKTTHLRGLLLETTALASSNAFYADTWGLTRVADVDAERSYWRGEGGEPWVLGLVSGRRNDLMRLRLGVASAADVDAGCHALRQAGIEVLTPPGPMAGPGGYYGMVLRDPDGRAVEVSAVTPVEPLSASGGTDRPTRMSHVVLNAPMARKTVAFYCDVLGFTISDWYEHDAIVFLRCNVDHHCLGISQSERASFNHVAYLLDDEASMLRAAQAAQAKGAQAVWGPGRHGPGGNAFSYFKDPNNVVVEYTAELIQIAPGQAWEAKQWERNPGNANVYGTGGPTPEAIRLMSGG